MRVHRGARVAAIAVAALLPGAATAAHSPPRVTTSGAAIQLMIVAANRHHVAAVTSRFTPTAVLTVSRRQLRGRRAIESWWRDEIAHRVRLGLASRVSTQGRVADGVILRMTTGGDCPKGCWERIHVELQGSRFRLVQLVQMRVPTPARPGKPGPKITPTIPT